MELCQRGSLFHVLQKRVNSSSIVISPSSTSSSSSSSSSSISSLESIRNVDYYNSTSDDSISNSSNEDENNNQQEIINIDDQINDSDISRRGSENDVTINGWNFDFILSLCIQASRSVAYLHSLNYIHRDLKSLNFLVTSDWKLKLSDFGLSRSLPLLTGHMRNNEIITSEPQILTETQKQFNHKQSDNNAYLTAKVGTRYWMVIFVHILYSAAVVRIERCI